MASRCLTQRVGKSIHTLRRKWNTATRDMESILALWTVGAVDQEQVGNIDSCCRRLLIFFLYATVFYQESITMLHIVKVTYDNSNHFFLPERILCVWREVRWRQSRSTLLTCCKTVEWRNAPEWFVQTWQVLVCTSVAGVWADLHSIAKALRWDVRVTIQSRPCTSEEKC